MTRTPRTPVHSGAPALLLTVGAASLLIACDGGIQRNISSDIEVTPPSVVFSQVRTGATDGKELQIRQSGEATLRVRSIKLQWAAGVESDFDLGRCDRVSLGLTPSQDLPAEIASLCRYIIDQRPALPGDMGPDGVEITDPYELGDDQFFNLDIRYFAAEPTAPPPAEVLIESNAKGSGLPRTQWGEVAGAPADEPRFIRIPLSVQSNEPRIAVAPTTIAFDPDGGRQTEIITVRNVNLGTTLRVARFSTEFLTSEPRDPVTGDPVREFSFEPLTDLPWSIEGSRSEAIEVVFDPKDTNADRLNVVFFSDDPNNPEIRVEVTTEPVFGLIEIAPNPVDFTDVRGGGQFEKLVTIRNTGRKSVDVLGAHIDPPESNEYRIVGQVSFQLPGGAAREITVVHEPTSPDGSNATLVLRTQNADNAEDAAGNFFVPLLRNADDLPASIRIAPAAVTFPAVAPGASDTATVVLSNPNPGGRPLEITKVRLSDASDSPLPASDAEFSVTVGGVDGAPVSLGAGQEHEIELTFARGAEDRSARIGVLIIESNAPTSPDAVYLSAPAPPSE